MKNNTCVCCGRVIPEGRQICLHCGDYDDQQTFRQPCNGAKRFFSITDDCGWLYFVATNRTDMTARDIVLLTPHVRAAREITRAEFEGAKM